MPHHPVYTSEVGTVGELVWNAAKRALGVLIMTSVQRKRN